jgi:hypothetical protein
MKCFSVDVRIIATAYILAETEEEAQKKAHALINESLEFSSRRQLIGDDVWMTGETYNRDMPEVSLSPAMTCHGPNGYPVEFVEDFDAVEEVG